MDRTSGKQKMLTEIIHDKLSKYDTTSFDGENHFHRISQEAKPGHKNRFHMRTQSVFNETSSVSSQLRLTKA